MRNVRAVMTGAVSAVLALGIWCGTAMAVEMETRSLDELYAAALEEGGAFVLRAGGDKPDQVDYYLDMFKKRFPKLKVTHSVDVSLNHAPRYDNARAAGGETNIPDVIQFQTLHDFNYYAERGLLDAYKPKNWDKV
ncbi:MAG: ABC transporter substrate-binding protein, partial [Pseudomonadota bacterium]